MLHGHGDDGYRFDIKIKADFSTNVWHGGEPSNLKKYLFERWSIINRYPEVLAETLGKKISNHYQLDTENILVTNGSTESIYLIAQAFKNSSSTIVIPSFSEYEDACKLFHHDCNFIHWHNLNSHLKISTDLFFLCNPNNPTGAVFFDLETLIHNNPQTIFIIDEAFIDFTTSISSAIGLIQRFENLIVMHSLTKTFAIPGLRLGYITAQANLISKLKAFKLPWSVNALAIEAGNFIFDNFSRIQIPLTKLLKDKDDFVKNLDNAPISICESHTHFFLAKLNKGRASELKNFLLENFGLLIRDAANFRGLTEKHFRLATLLPENNQLMIKALEAWKDQ